MNRWTKTLGAILASALLFTACAPATDPEPDETSSEEVSNSGYVSGDGTVTVWGRVNVTTPSSSRAKPSTKKNWTWPIGRGASSSLIFGMPLAHPAALKHPI